MAKKYIPAPLSLHWHGDELVDWVNSGVRYNLDGSYTTSSMNFVYRFDAAVVSFDGMYSAIFERLGTKGLIFKVGTFIREINRSYYCADEYEYPITFLRLPDDRMAIAHCPEEYCKLEIEDVETGERLTRRDSTGEDFFHSRLSVSDDGRYLASSGWVWHPWEAICLYNVEEAFSNPDALNGGDIQLARSTSP
jgi:hypothetical protein